jgi:MYXO-CTERM domain-containing protein
MKWRVMLVCIGLLCGCGDAPIELENLGASGHTIVNGTFDSGDPAVVYIDVGCSGTLVTPKVVLTACHCLQGSYSSPDVFFGSDTNGQGTWIQGVHHATYPGNCIGDGDLAMITLAQPGPAPPIPINDRNLGNYVGNPVRIVGFGVTGENSGGSGTKRQGMSVLSSVGTGEMFCDPTQSSGTCYGDSGGPNFMTFEGTEYVVGATSYGTQACGSGLDASARTDSHMDWLQTYINEQDPADCGADGACAMFCDAPDPDCPCANDGYCTDLCPDLTVDADCNGCGQDGECRSDCPSLDTDCCVADGECLAACGDADPDCDDGANGNGSGPGNGSGNGTGPGTASGSGDGNGRHDELGSGGLVGSVACSSAAPGGDGGGWSAVMLLALGMVARRRQMS